jgi:hypothetical protein
MRPLVNKKFKSEIDMHYLTYIVTHIIVKVVSIVDEHLLKSKSAYVDIGYGLCTKSGKGQGISQPG